MAHNLLHDPVTEAKNDATTSIRTKPSKAEKKRVQAALLGWIADTGRPIKMVEDKGLADFGQAFMHIG